MESLKALADAIIKGKAADAAAGVEQALAAGMPAIRILDEGLIAGMAVVGDRFRKNEVYVPQVLISARAMKACMKVLQPHLSKAGVEPRGTIVLGTVKGDLHDIGKNLVAMMLEGAGYRVIDLGVDVPAERFLAAVAEHGARIVAMSALLTTTMPAMKDVIDAFAEAGVKVRFMIGGAPVTAGHAVEIGADGYAGDASTAVDVADRLSVA